MVIESPDYSTLFRVFFQRDFFDAEMVVLVMDRILLMLHFDPCPFSGEIV